MSKVRDFNLLKVADVSANSTNTNSVSVVVNTDNGGNSQNDAINFHQPIPTSTSQTPSSQTTIFPNELTYPSLSNQPTTQHVAAGLRPTREQELEFQLINTNSELRFYKLLSQTFSNILRDNNPKLLINLIDQSGKVIIEAPVLIELIAIKTNTDKNLVNIQFVEEETNCLGKVSPIKRISNIKIDNETFSLKYNREYNILQDDYKISLAFSEASIFDNV